MSVDANDGISYFVPIYREDNISLGQDHIDLEPLIGRNYGCSWAVTCRNKGHVLEFSNTGFLKVGHIEYYNDKSESSNTFA